VCWTLTVLLRGNPKPDMPIIIKAFLNNVVLALDIVNEYMCTPTERVTIIEHVVQCLAYGSEEEGEYGCIDFLVTKVKVVPRLVQILSEFRDSPAICKLVLRCLGNFCGTTNDSIADCVIAAGFLKHAYRILDEMEDAPDVQRELVWTLSNLAAGTAAHRLAILKAETNLKLFTLIVQMSQDAVWSVRKEALFVLCNYAILGNSTDMERLVEYGGVQSFCQFLQTCESTGLLLEVMDALYRILEHETVEAKKVIYECQGLDYLENLQDHKCDSVYLSAVKILTTFFCGEEEDDNFNDSENIQVAVNDDGSQFLFGLPSKYMYPDGLGSPTPINFGSSNFVNFSGTAITSNLTSTKLPLGRMG
jgi:hypothetical protein